VDAVLALMLPTAATGDLVTAVRAADVRVPMAAVVLNQAETVRLLPRATDGGLSGTVAEPPCIPAYGDAEAAAHALARAAAYGLWRTRPTGHLPEFSDVAENQARELVRAFLDRSPQGGWLSPGETVTLLGCYQVPVTSPGPTATVASTDGTAVMIGVAQEPVFGPVVTFGLGDTTAGVLAGRAARLAPLTDTEADELIHSVPAAPLVPGHGGDSPGGRTALPDILLRVSRLADDLPEIAELDLNPVIVRPDGVAVGRALIRLAPAKHQDPFLRKLH
jgi:acyl-CoA synthetase (NDP forming)